VPSTGPAEPVEPARRPESPSEEKLRDLLEQASVLIDLEAEKGTREALREAGLAHFKELQRVQSLRQTRLPRVTSAIEQVLAKRDDLKGLPLLLGNACRMSKEQAAVLSAVSVGARDRSGQENLRQSLATIRAADRTQTALLVRPFEQIYQVEDPSLRKALVTSLAQVEDREATRALARRAVFDLSPTVRAAAVEALKQRNLDDARPVLLWALRYPWPPSADHAALALVALRDSQAAPTLRTLLDEPDPAAPYRTLEGKWARKELVRVNHLRNCLLCHPASLETRGELRAPIPTPGEPLGGPPPRKLPGNVRSQPPLQGRQQYYHRQEADSQDLPPPARPSVRADIVYFRQDFSVLHRVAGSDPWPDMQRFDYLLRESEVSEVGAAFLCKEAAKRRTYPQREAVRYALAKLEPRAPVP
jgi:hypothetical protein